MIQVLLIKGGFSILLDIFHFMQLQVGYWIHLFLLSALWWEGGLMPALCNFYFIGVHGRWSSHPHLVWTFYSSLQVTPEHVLGLIFFKIEKLRQFLDTDVHPFVLYIFHYLSRSFTKGKKIVDIMHVLGKRLCISSW